MKEIVLTNSDLKAKVSDKDYIRVRVFNWQLHKGGYAYTCVFGETWYLHRVIMNLHAGNIVQTDHKDGDRLNCTRSNLRFSTQLQNTHNSSSRKGSTSKYKGVSFQKATRKWLAQIVVNGKNKFLGTFTLEIWAAQAYDVAALQYFGKFAKLNFPKTHTL